MQWPKYQCPPGEAVGERHPSRPARSYGERCKLLPLGPGTEPKEGNVFCVKKFQTLRDQFIGLFAILPVRM